MSDHDFEKRVKQKMDELKFTPSDAVWQAVQLEIRKDKPRRRGLVLIPILLAGLGVGAYFLYYNSNKSSQVLSEQSTHSKISKPSDSDNAPESNSPVTPASSENEKTHGTAGSKEAKEPGLSSDKLKPGIENNNSEPAQQNPGSTSSDKLHETGKINKGENRDAHKTIIPVAENSGSGATTKNPSIDIQKPRSSNRTGGFGNVSSNNVSSNKIQSNKIPPNKIPQNGIQPNNISGQNPSNGVQSNQSKKVLSNPISQDNSKELLVDQPVQSPAVVQAQSSVRPQTQSKQLSQDAKNSDSIGEVVVDDQKKLIQADSAVAQNPTLKSEQQNDSSAAEIKDLVKSRKKKTGWDWGVNVSGGIANINDGPLTGVLKSNNMADAASSPQASNNFLFTPSAAGIPPPKASEVKAGAYFSIGGYVTKQLSKRFSVSAGLQYSQYNTIIEVGYRVDSSRLVNNGSQVQNVARYYRADDNSKFSNKYHFIELPLTLHTRITGPKALPLFWNIGIHVAQMIGSNALVFDSGTGVYYKDKSTLNKTQLGFATGFTVGLFGKSKLPMLIGPSVKYNAGEMFKKDIPGDKHLISAGLDLRILLNKK